MTIKDLSNQTFGRWTVLRYSHKDEKGYHHWLCQCECGTIKKIRTIGLSSGTSQSCGCLRRELTSKRSKTLADTRKETIIGQTFARLTVLSVSHVDQYRSTHYKCQCSCGRTTTVRGSSLGTTTKSCGCLFLESSRTHGLTNHPLYMTWINLRRRCNDENHEAYHNYGGRGIFVCSEWNNSFESFFEWAIMNGYTPGLSLDRINNNDGYYPGNCRFVTYSTQNQNRQTTKLNHEAVADIRSSSLTSRELAEKYNVTVGHINNVRSGKGWLE